MCLLQGQQEVYLSSTPDFFAFFSMTPYTKMWMVRELHSVFSPFDLHPLKAVVLHASSEIYHILRSVRPVLSQGQKVMGTNAHTHDVRHYKLM